MPVGNAASWGLDSSSVGQSLVDPGGGAATWGLLGAEQPYAGSDQIADAGNMWQGGNFGQYWDPRLDPGAEIELHSHTCPACEVSWAHGDCCFGDDGAHTCPSCGTVQWRKNVVGMADGGSAVGAVSEDEMSGLNEAIILLTDEVNRGASRARQEDAPDAAALTSFQGGRWTPFVMRWNVFFQDHGTFISRLFIDPEFAAFKLEYDQLRQEWLGLGGETSAPSSTNTSAPFDIPWMWIGLAAAAIGLLYFGGPILIASAASRIRA